MRTLYTKIVATVSLLLLVSALLSLLFSNVIYYLYWQREYSAKVERTVDTAISYYEAHGDSEPDAFYEMLSRTGYQLHVEDAEGNVKRFGNPFRDESIGPDVVERVKGGEPYHGMRDYPFHLFLLGLFDNEVINTYGVALENERGTDAVFIRPDLSRQIRELHLFVGLFLALLVVISFLLLVFAARYIVKPLKTLTSATKRMTEGDYTVELPTRSRDEIGQLSRQFNEMAIAVSRTDEERKAFVANVSHEFQSPLASLKGYARKLRQPLSEAERDRTASIIEQEADRMSELTRQLLTLARLDEGASVKRTRVLLAPSIERTLMSLEYELDEKGIAVVSDVPDHLALFADEALLEQVWHNVLRNAMRASSPGSTIRVKASETANAIEVEIRDEGHGMSDETKERLFERFYKGDVSRASVGSGLGLSIVAEILVRLEASVEVDSVLGQGTVFHFRFPKI